MESDLHSGSHGNLDGFFSRLYNELREIAGRNLRREREDHTLQPTALVHEAYLKLSASEAVQCRNPRHFRMLAARVIRRVLADHATARNTEKRGGRVLRVTLIENLAVTNDNEIDFAALDTALSKLADIDEEQCRIVELRFFGGLTIPEAAAELEVSERKVSAQWAMARAWLAWKIKDGNS